MAQTVEAIRPESAGGIVAGNLRKIGKGALVAFFDVEIAAWHLKIAGCKLFRNNNGEWVGLPSERFESRDGAVRYKNLVEFTDSEAGERFQAAALAAVKKLL